MVLPMLERGYQQILPGLARTGPNPKKTFSSGSPLPSCPWIRMDAGETTPPTSPKLLSSGVHLTKRCKYFAPQMVQTQKNKSRSTRTPRRFSVAPPGLWPCWISRQPMIYCHRFGVQKKNGAPFVLGSGNKTTTRLERGVSQQ